jgi:cytochrome c peroxidase
MKLIYLFIVLCFSYGAHAEYSLVRSDQDKKWLLPDEPPYPELNQPTTDRVTLGKMLYFEPRISGNGITSCATCHNPSLGWTDGLAKAIGFKGKELARGSPTVINTAYNTIQMWDGRKKDLEDQASGPMESPDEMHVDFVKVYRWLNDNPEYKMLFEKAYPGEPIDVVTMTKAIASFERTLVSNNSPFDRWLKGDNNALTKQQIRGFRLFEDPQKGNCTICHSAPNFTNNGFHNIGLKSHDQENADMGRFVIKPLPSMRGAFKTPTLRDVALTAPYFHDGSATTLKEVMEHYNRGGSTAKDLSPDIKPLQLNEQEMADIVAFMEALTSPPLQVVLPILPRT